MAVEVTYGKTFRLLYELQFMFLRKNALGEVLALTEKLKKRFFVKIDLFFLDFQIRHLLV